MKWNKYTIETTTAAEDMLSVMLSELGIEGVEIENNVPLTEAETSGMFIDFPPQLPPDTGESRVSFYLDAEEDNNQRLKEVAAMLEQGRQFMDIGPGRIISSQTEDVDWINNWKQFFKAFTVGNILIKPTWEPAPAEDEGKIVIEIDPGISFGTGQHETTQLCIRQLQKYIKGSPNVLDIGCGSGILSIAALKLGADRVVGCDIDENCIVSAYENMRSNHMDKSRVVFYAGNFINYTALQQKVGTGQYDIVTANILADVIIPMIPAVCASLKPNGIFITSGIIDFKEQAVREALEQAGLKILETNHQGEWVNITCTSFL